MKNTSTWTFSGHTVCTAQHPINTHSKIHTQPYRICSVGALGGGVLRVRSGISGALRCSVTSSSPPGVCLASTRGQIRAILGCCRCVMKQPFLSTITQLLHGVQHTPKPGIWEHDSYAYTYGPIRPVDTDSYIVTIIYTITIVTIYHYHQRANMPKLLV